MHELYHRYRQQFVIAQWYCAAYAAASIFIICSQLLQINLMVSNLTAMLIISGTQRDVSASYIMRTFSKFSFRRTMAASCAEPCRLSLKAPMRTEKLLEVFGWS